MLLEWTAGQLDTAHRDFLDAMSPSVTLNVDDLGDVLFCHATPRSDDEILTVRTPAERVRPMLAGTTANTVVCGHTHMQFDRALDGIRVVNAGSVGMPYGRTGAHWLLVGPDIKLVNTSYDLSLAAEGISSSAYPDAEEFAERYVLSPRSEEEMLQLFER
jgi:predicted phosphodiesterase